MSLLNVPSTPFPPVFSPSTTTPAPLTGIRLNPCATPLWGGPSGHLADPTPNTGYEPKICIDVASTRRSIFRPETRVSSNSTTRQSPHSMTSIYLNIPEHHAAASHTAASAVPTLLKPGSSGTSLRKLSADNDSVASRTSIKETCADLARETVVSSLFRVCVKGKERWAPKRCANIERHAKSPQIPWTENWIGRARRKIGSAKILRSWGRLGGETLGKEKFWYCSSWDQSGVLNPNDYNYNKRINGLIRLKEIKIGLHGELELRKSLFRENQAKDWQETGELSGTGCEETDRGRRARIDGVSMHQERNPTTVSQLLTRIQDLQNKVNSLSDARDFYDPESGSSSGMSRVFQSTVKNSESQPEPCLAAIRDCRMIHGILRVLQETFLNDSLLEKDDPLLCSTIQRIWHRPLKNWDLTFLEIQSNWKVKWDKYLYHASKVEVDCWIILVELILTVVWLIFRDFQPRSCIWENFLTLWNFKAGKSTSRLKYVLKQQILISQRTGSKKLRWPSQLTNLRHRDRL